MNCEGDAGSDRDSITGHAARDDMKHTTAHLENNRAAISGTSNVKYG